MGLQAFDIVAPDPVPAGKAAVLTMFVNGTKVAEGELERTIPFQISLGEGPDIGMDVGSPVHFTYKLPFVFTGESEKVTIEFTYFRI